MKPLFEGWKWFADGPSLHTGLCSQSYRKLLTAGYHVCKGKKHAFVLDNLEVYFNKVETLKQIRCTPFGMVRFYIAAFKSIHSKSKCNLITYFIASEVNFSDSAVSRNSC